MSGSSLNMSQLGQSMLGPPSAQDALEQSSILVDRAMSADFNYLDMSDLLQVPKHTMPSVSGLHDFDYPSLSDPKIGLNSLSSLTSIKKVPLPAELVEQFGHMQCNCMMGLFPEISRAWLSIDSDIFVWNYEDGSDLAYFDGLSESILSAGLVAPKPGIFQPHITHLLCLSTAVDIVLLGVSFNRPYESAATDANYCEMHLLPEPLFSIPTDNVNIVSITGAKNGRIFMAGKDGCLYELHYQAEDGWFSRKCRKVNHSTSKLSFMVPSFLNFSFVDDDSLVQISIDDSRNIIYTRSEKGTIQVYDMGEDGKGMSRVAAISQHTTMQNAALVARTIDKSNFKSIVHIAAIPKSESVNVHLVAVTSSGVRLYFTTNPFNENRGRPSMLSMVHVRLPPGFSASAAPHKPTNVHKAHYKKGTLLLAAAQSEDNDLLWTIGPDSFPFQKLLMETQEMTAIDGHTWAVAEVPQPPGTYEEQTLSRGPLQKANPPLVVTQHMESPRRFILINSQGSYLMNLQSPADQLKQLLLRHNGPDAEEVQAFFKLHKSDQACATCLILACSSLNQAEMQVSDWATRAFFLYGGEPEYNYNMGMNPQGFNPGTPMGPGAQGYTSFSSPAGQGFNPNQMSTPYPNLGQSFQMMSPGGPSSMPQSMGGQQEVMFSGKLSGLSLYLARILRPFWEQRMVSDVPYQTAKGNMQYLASRYRSEELSWFLEELNALKNFMDRNSQFSSPILAESYAAPAHNMSQMLMTSRIDGGMDEQTRRKQQAEVQAQERASLQQLQQMIHHICECLGLWKIVCDHQFHIVASGLSKDQQNILKTMSFRIFVTAGKDMASALIQCLINRYLNDNAVTDAISSRLREIAPSLYSPEDAVCSKAHEKLQGAKNTQHRNEQDQQLRDSLQLYKQITSQLDLPVVCTQFAAVRFYSGIVDLSLTAASKKDPQQLALHFYRHGEPPEDVQGLQAFVMRKDCYRCITETLEFLLSTSLSHPQAPSVPKSPGPPPAQDPNTLTNAEAEQYSEQVYALCLRSDDELFHVFLYDWLVHQNLTEKLLEIKSPYLEPYLQRAAALAPENLTTLDLLWRYHEKSRNYSAAARILAKLAERHSTDVNLQQRIEYLSRATMSAKSATTTGAAASEGEFLHELEEKMEVARLQLQIFDALSKQGINQPNIQEALTRLNSELMDISTLYGEFADVFDLSECKLGIIHCAGHYDPTLVESLWQEIIQKELSTTVKDTVNTQMNTLKNKLVQLGRMYAGTERYFPVAFLVKYLERRSCELNFDVTFAFRTMLDIGVTVSKLHEIYDRLLKSKDPCWQSLRKPFHLLQVLSMLLDSFADNPTLVPAYERRPFTNTCLDSVGGYLVELQATSSTDPTIRSLMDKFRGVQSKLDRIL